MNPNMTVKEATALITFTTAISDAMNKLADTDADVADGVPILVQFLASGALGRWGCSMKHIQHLSSYVLDNLEKGILYIQAEERLQSRKGTK